MTLKQQAEALVGHELEVDKTADGKFIVLWMRFEVPPPPKGDTEEEAWSKFIAFIKSQSPEPVIEENTENGN